MIRTLCLTLALATATCATIAVATYSSPAPAATPAAPAEQPVRNEGVRNEGVRPVNPADPCRVAVWPQIPAECIRNDNEGRAKRAVRVIPIHSAGAN